MIDDDDLVGKFFGFVHQMSGEQHAHTVAAQGVDQFPHQQPGLGVQAGGGFVEEHQFRATDERARQREALLLPTGESPVRSAAGVLESEALQQPIRIEWVGGVGRHQIEHLPGLGTRIAPPPCNMTPIRGRRRSDWVIGSSPRTRTVPASGVTNPSHISTVVVLPAPLGPSRAST